MLRFRFIFLCLFIAFSNMAYSLDDIQLLWENKLNTSIREVKLSPTDNNLAVAVGANGLYILNTLNGEIIHFFKNQGQLAVNTIEFMNDGVTLVCGTINGKLFITDANTGEINKIIDLNPDNEFNLGLYDLEFTPDEKHLIATTKYINVINTSDWSIEKQWNDVTYWEESPPTELYDKSTKITISYDGKYVAAYFLHNDIVVIYDIETMERVKSFGSKKWGIEFANTSNILIFDSGRKLYNIDDDSLRNTDILSTNHFWSFDDSKLFSFGKYWRSYNSTTFEVQTEIDLGSIISPSDLKDDRYILTKYVSLYDISNFTSVSENPDDGLYISPNPASDVIIISNIPVNAQNIELLDMQGNMLEAIELKSNSGILNYNISHLPQGIYFIRLITDNSTNSFKFVINR